MGPTRRNGQGKDKAFDLGAYLKRIGLQGSPSLDAIHRAHLTSIPFENLDPHRGVPVSLDSQVLARKLIANRRGGICFEQNALLRHALEALGTQVDVFLSRVRTGSRPAWTRPRSHPVLRVWRSGKPLLVDVGFGIGGPLEPIPMRPGTERSQAGWRFRIARDGDELVLQQAGAGGWSDLYGFVPEPVSDVELDVSCWYTSTHPDSRFVSGLCVSRHRPDGGRTTLCDWSGQLTLAESAPVITDVSAVDWSEAPDLLASRFDLPGFTLGANRRLRPR